MARRNPPSGEGRIAAEMAQLARAQTTTPSAGVFPSSSGGLSWTPAGGGQFIGGTPSNVPGGTSQPGAPRPAVVTPTQPGEEPPGGGDQPPPGDTAPTGPTLEELRRRQNAIDALIQRLAEWGLTGLGGIINDLMI